MPENARILMIQDVTHDVKRFVLEKPDGFEFQPGQGCSVAIDESKWKDQERPFTPTSLAEDAVLEFTIKGYPDHEGVTRQLHTLSSGDALLLGDVFGTIQYRGPGVFIAGGAGVTPFLAILRRLARDGQIEGNRLVFSNKTHRDVILEHELEALLGTNLLLTLTQEQRDGYLHGRVDANFLGRHLEGFDVPFYVCGPPKMVEQLTATLKDLGASPDNVVFEQD